MIWIANFRNNPAAVWYRLCIFLHYINMHLLLWYDMIWYYIIHYEAPQPCPCLILLSILRQPQQSYILFIRGRSSSHILSDSFLSSSLHPPTLYSSYSSFVLLFPVQLKLQTIMCIVRIFLSPAWILFVSLLCLFYISPHHLFSIFLILFYFCPLFRWYRHLFLYFPCLCFPSYVRCGCSCSTSWADLFRGICRSKQVPQTKFKNQKNWTCCLHFCFAGDDTIL